MERASTHVGVVRRANTPRDEQLRKKETGRRGQRERVGPKGGDQGREGEGGGRELDDTSRRLPRRTTLVEGGRRQPFVGCRVASRVYLNLNIGGCNGRPRERTCLVCRPWIVQGRPASWGRRDAVESEDRETNRRGVSHAFSSSLLTLC